MKIDVKDWSDVVKVESSTEENDIYTISITFLDDEVMTYGYLNKRQWLKDYNYLIGKFNRRL